MLHLQGILYAEIAEMLLIFLRRHVQIHFNDFMTSALLCLSLQM